MKYQLGIIGGGPAGYTAAEEAGKAGLSVVLFEKENLGGVCLNEGCIPTKTLLYSAKIYQNAKDGSKYGVTVTDASTDLGKIITRKSKVVRKLVLGVKARLTAQHVNIIPGEAKITDKNHIECNGETYECDNLLLCTGSETFIPPIKGIETVSSYWTHKEALMNKEIPGSLIVIGGGVIGMEFASFFHTLGSEVTVVEMLDEILTGMDRELSGLLREEYAKKGVRFSLATRVISLESEGNTIRVNCENESGATAFVAERVLISTGRRPVMKGFGVENLALTLTNRGVIQVNEHMQSSLENVYICGDLNGISLLAHTAVRQAEVAVHHMTGKEDSMSYKAIPGVIYTNPEFAGIGETEELLKLKNVPYQVRRLPMSYSGRFVAENEGINGICKLITAEDTTILGVHVLGNPASEIITIAGMAIENSMKMEEWKKIVFPHPTVAEIFREIL